MRRIFIGHNPQGERIYLTPELRSSTHMHVVGSSGKGKSKFLEQMIREDIRAGHGICLIDWHGTLYKDVVNYCARLRVGLNVNGQDDFRSPILLNPSQPDFITGFNPFMNQGVDVGTQVANRIAATIRPWGITDTDQMPSFERVCRLLYTFAVEKQETLPNAAQLLEFEKPELREYAIQAITDEYIKRQWQQLQLIKNFRDWKELVLSTENRFARFLASRTIKRFLGLTEHNINLREIMDSRQILLINLGASGHLDRESARVFASLLLNEFFETAMLRANDAQHGPKPTTFALYLDEFQEYITDDIGAMLDQIRKGGLHMVLAHQHLGHLADNRRLQKSIFTNARIRAVFGGVDYEDACFLGNELFLPDLNTRQIKQAYYHTIHLYEEETRLQRSHATGVGRSTGSNWSESKGTALSEGTSRGTSYGSGYSFGSSSTSTFGESRATAFSPSSGFGDGYEGWPSGTQTTSSSQSDSFVDAFSDFSSESFSETSSVTTSESLTTGGSEAESEFSSVGETIVPFLKPIPKLELGSEAEWSREEKLSRVAEMLIVQQQQIAFIKLDTQKTQPLKVPFVKEYSHPPEYLLKYKQAIYEKQGALPAHQVDQLLIESGQRFLRAAQSVIDIEAREVPAARSDIPKPTRKRNNGRKQSTTNVFDIIDVEHNPFTP